MRRLKHSIKLTGLVALVSITTFGVLALFISFFGDFISNLFIYNPFISGFMHGDVSHLGYNLLAIFLFTLPSVNSDYKFKDIYRITFIVALLYLPVVFITDSTPAIGISGTCMFLAGRYLLSGRGRVKWIGFMIFGALIGSEALSIGDDDGIAHIVHIIGGLLGALSLTKFPQFFSRNYFLPSSKSHTFAI